MLRGFLCCRFERRCFSTNIFLHQISISHEVPYYVSSLASHFIPLTPTFSLRIPVSVLIRFLTGAVNVLLSCPPRLDRLWGLLSLLSSGYRGPFLGLYWPKRVGDHSPPSSAEVNTWSCASAPTYVFMALC